jgi:hypothetical protein
VSPDTAGRETFALQAMERAVKAEEQDHVFLGGGAMGVLVLRISALPAEARENFLAACGGLKARGNYAMLALDGQFGEIRLNAGRTCWVIDLASPRRTIMFGWTSGPRETRLGGPRQNVTNGGSHWCGVVSATMPIDPDRAPATVEYLRWAMACLAEHGRTPRQQAAHLAAEEAARRAAEERRVAAVATAAAAPGTQVVLQDSWGCANDAARRWLARAEEIGDIADLADQLAAEMRAAQLAAEEAAIMAALEVEQAAAVAAQAAAAAEAARQAEIAAAAAYAGVTPVQWQTMTPKQQRLAMHRARLAGRLS